MSEPICQCGHTLNEHFFYVTPERLGACDILTCRCKTFTDIRIIEAEREGERIVALEAQLAEAKETIKSLTFTSEMYQGAYQFAKNMTLGEIAEAKRDSERERKRLDAAIDLLGRCEALTFDYDEGTYHIDWGYVDGVFGPEGCGKTPREAIDAAMKAKEEQ